MAARRMMSRTQRRLRLHLNESSPTLIEPHSAPGYALMQLRMKSNGN